MSDLPNFVCIEEEGPREGFQMAPGPIPTARKVELIEALAETGVTRIDCVSYVDPRRVPGMADAETVARAVRKLPGVRYTGLWLNLRGLERALALPLDIIGSIRITASDTFSRRNTGMSIEQTVTEQRRWLAAYREHGIPVEWGYVMTAFGCNIEGDFPVAQVLAMVDQLLALAAEAGVALKGVYLADTVGWGTPRTVERRIGAVPPLVRRIAHCSCAALPQPLRRSPPSSLTSIEFWYQARPGANPARCRAPWRYG